MFPFIEKKHTIAENSAVTCKIKLDFFAGKVWPYQLTVNQFALSYIFIVDVLLHHKIEIDSKQLHWFFIDVSDNWPIWVFQN